MGSVAGQSMASTGGLLLGRRTYDDFYAVWPERTDNPFTEVLNKHSEIRQDLGYKVTLEPTDPTTSAA